MAPARGRLASHGLPGLRKELRVRRGLDPSLRAYLSAEDKHETAPPLPAPPVAGDTPPEAGRKKRAIRPNLPVRGPHPAPEAIRNTDTAEATKAT